MGILLEGFAHERSAGLHATCLIPFFNAKLELVRHAEADTRIVSFLDLAHFLVVIFRNDVKSVLGWGSILIEELLGL